MLRRIFLLATFLFIQACSVITSYPPKINKSIEALKQNIPSELSNSAVSSISRSKYIGDSILYKMELGRIYQVTNDIDKSIDSFDDAIDEVKNDEERAIVSAKNLLEQTSSILVNDNVIEYTGKPFEHTMLHTFQALNYLFKNNLEDATPEVRLAGDNQVRILEENQKKIDEAKELNENQKQSLYQANKIIKEHYAGDLNETAGKVKNSFQNAYAFYVAGLIYELHGEKQNAYLDYKNALEIKSNNVYFQRDAIRLAFELGEKRDLNDYRRKFPSSYSFVQRTYKSQGAKLLILIEDDFVAQKEEVKIPIITDTKGGLVTVGFPTFKTKYKLPSTFRVLKNKMGLGYASLACDLNPMSYFQFKQELPGILTREIIRIIERAVVHELAKGRGNNNNGQQSNGEAIAQAVFMTWDVVNMTMDLFAAKVDLRGWYTLPRTMHVFKSYISNGKQTITIKNNNDGKSINVDINATKGSLNIIRVIKAGSSYYTKNITY